MILMVRRPDHNVRGSRAVVRERAISYAWLLFASLLVLHSLSALIGAIQGEPRIESDPAEWGRLAAVCLVFSLAALSAAVAAVGQRLTSHYAVMGIIATGLASCLTLAYIAVAG
jgi:hypothetical protein